MDSTVCPGCKLRVEPIRVFECDDRTKKWWRITRCPRERCNYNLDLERCDKPGTGSRAKGEDDGRYFRSDI